MEFRRVLFRSPSPEYDRRCQNQFDPALGSALKPVDKVHRHVQAHDNNRQRQGPPETSPDIFQFRILVFIKSRELGFQRHPASRAMAGLSLADLRMHGAGVLGAGYRHCAWLCIMLMVVMLGLAMPLSSAEGRVGKEGESPCGLQ